MKSTQSLVGGLYRGVYRRQYGAIELSLPVVATMKVVLLKCQLEQPICRHVSCMDGAAVVECQK
jgi:hypothetical protein